MFNIIDIRIGDTIPLGKRSPQRHLSLTEENLNRLASGNLKDIDNDNDSGNDSE